MSVPGGNGRDWLSRSAKFVTAWIALVTLDVVGLAVVLLAIGVLRRRAGG